MVALTYSHAPGLHAQANLTTDATQAQYGQCLAIQLSAAVKLTIPATFLHALASRDNGTGQCCN